MNLKIFKVLYIFYTNIDDMLDMKFETDYMNEMMNRNYNIDADENDLDEEMRELGMIYFIFNIDDDLFQDVLN